MCVRERVRERVRVSTSEGKERYVCGVCMCVIERACV